MKSLDSRGVIGIGPHNHIGMQPDIDLTSASGDELPGVDNIDERYSDDEIADKSLSPRGGLAGSLVDDMERVEELAEALTGAGQETVAREEIAEGKYVAEKTWQQAESGADDDVGEESDLAFDTRVAQHALQEVGERGIGIHARLLLTHDDI